MRNQENRTKGNAGPWSETENAAVSLLYCGMASAVMAGTKYSKAQLIREQQAGELSARSKGSIEAKLMNVSAIVVERALMTRLPSGHVPGYKPAPNYQTALVGAVIQTVTFLQARSVELGGVTSEQQRRA